MLHPHALPDRLRRARDHLRLTQEQASRMVGIGPSSLSEFETGRRAPSLSQLQKLAQAYRKPLSHFLGDHEPADAIVLWRARPDDKTAADIEARFLLLCEQYKNLEEWCGESALHSLPTLSGPTGTFGYAEATALAKSVRDELQLGDRPGQGLSRTLEEICSVKVFHLPIEPTGTAASTFSEAFGPAVLLNSGNVFWRRNFDLAHELFHLLTWRIFRGAGARSADQDQVASDSEEQLANCFARNLLLPEEAFRIAVEQRLGTARTLRLSDIEAIARQFAVSGEAALWQMKSLYGRGEAETRRDIDRLRVGCPSTTDRPSEQPPTRPARFVALAAQALRRGHLSVGRYAEYVGISRQAALKFAEQEASDDADIRVAPA